MDDSDGQIKTLAVYSYPNEKLDLLPYMAMSRDKVSSSPITCQGSILKPTSKIRRSNIYATAGFPIRKISKFECIVI